MRKPVILFALAFLFIFCGCSYASLVVVEQNVYGYSLNQWCDAIYLAEGGSHAQYPYGIRSVKCEGKEGCREVCKRTVRNNVKRYKKYGYKQYPQFIQFLGERFCPTKGRNLSASEKRLNKNWIHNVERILNEQ